MYVIKTAFITGYFDVNIIFFVLKIKKLQLFEKMRSFCVTVYYGSYNFIHTWSVGVVILFLTIATAFIGYVLP